VIFLGMRAPLTVLGGLLLLWSASTPCTDSIGPATSTHTVTLHGRPVTYEVTWSGMTLPPGATRPDTTISATSYVRTDEPGMQRPVAFAFNGGPGASSTPLHFGLLGPRARTTPAPGGPTAAASFVDNPDSLLDIADLVLIDPVGTGFNEELRPGGNQPYLTVATDAKAVETLIREWLADRGRTSSPVVLIGESYGGTRLAQLTRTLGDLDVRGLVLISAATDMAGTVVPGSDQAYIEDLPSMAVTAAYHKRGYHSGEIPSKVYETARAFAQGPYAVALQAGNHLPSTERVRVAGEMSKLLGLPAANIAKLKLRVPSQDFLEQLLPGKIVGRIDTRVTAPANPAPLIPGRRKEADDPALAMGASNVKKSPSAREYLQKEVGVQTDRDYVALTLDVNFAWDWRATSPKFEDNIAYLDSTPHLVTFMATHPAVRMFVAQGYYDLATPVLAMRYALSHSNVPGDRTTIRAYAGGHTIYEDGAARHALAEDLRAFLERLKSTGLDR
jgi:carboxypeptidase C (cathepsin A)